MTRSRAAGLLALLALAAGTALLQPGATPPNAALAATGSSSDAVLLLATGASGSLGGEFHPGGAWQTAPVVGGSTGAPALSSPGDGTAIGVAQAPLNFLQFTRWQNGVWTSFATVPGSVTTSAGPSAAGAAGSVQVAYRGADTRYYYAVATGAQWSPGAEPVGTPQAYGPAGPAIAAPGADAAVAYEGPDNALYVQVRTSGAWSAPQQVATGLAPAVTPSLVALTGGSADLLVAYAGADLLIHYSIRTAGAWSAPASISGAGTPDRPALLALPNGGALLAIRASDGNAYYAVYSGGAWSRVAPVFAPAPAQSSVPALAAGAGDATAELGVLAGGTFYHTRLVGGAWSAPVQVPVGNYTNLALVTVPGPPPTATPTATATAAPTDTPGGAPTCAPGIGPWAYVAPYPVGLQSPAVATDGAYVYAAGGYDGSAALDRFSRYDPVANTWTTLPPLPTALYDARAAYDPSTNSLYVAGGVVDGVASARLYIYNLGAGAWSSGAPAPAPRVWPAVAYYAPAGKIYVIGGRDPNGVDQQQTWAYDPATDTWDTSHTADPAAAAGAVATVVGQYMYLMGPNTLNYRYDVTQDTWASMAPLPVAHTVAAGGAIGGRIAIAGGGDSTATSVYDIGTDSWTSGPDLNLGRAVTGGTALGGRLIVVGGWIPSSNTNTNTVEMTAPLPCSTPTTTPPDTPTSTSTETPTATATSAATSTATITPTATPCSACSLAVTQVTLSCKPDGTVHWTAAVRNNGSCSVSSYWGVVLAGQHADGAWQDLTQAAGSANFPPGATTLSGDLTYRSAPSVRALRAAFAISGAPPWCPAGGISAPIAPCPAR